jgi:hypothetical protein
MTATDEPLARLHAAGWSVGEAGSSTRARFVWQVDAINGGHPHPGVGRVAGNSVAAGRRPGGLHSGR